VEKEEKILVLSTINPLSWDLGKSMALCLMGHG
jgi:hypothetical protein